MKPISICIPTFNRADKLAQCLEHLCTFSDQDFEVVIGNNCSDDHTDKVVADFSRRLNNLVYLKHPANLGFARNMDAILRRANREYLYILNDDDFVFENALDLAIQLMADPEVMGVVGTYYSFRQLDPKLTTSFENAVVTTVNKYAYSALLENLSLCDGHPVLRRSIFHRHCSYLDRTSMLIPLYFRLISFGKVLAVDKPFFQHRTTGDSLTARMAEAWFLDMANADLELAVQQAIEFLPIESLQKARHRLLHTLYFQAARMSISRKQPYLLWLFLKRLAGIRALDEQVAILCEYHFMHEILTDHLRRQIKDAQYKRILVVAESNSCKLVAPWDMVVTAFESASQALHHQSTDDLILLDDWPEEIADGVPAGTITLIDTILRLRLTKIPCQYGVLGERLQLAFSQPEILSILSKPHAGFQVLCAPYSEE